MPSGLPLTWRRGLKRAKRVAEITVLGGTLIREAKWEALERLTAAVQGAVEAMGKEAVR